QRAGYGFAGHHDLDINGDLLASADQQQVDVLDVVAQGVPDDGLGQGELGATAFQLEGQDGVRATLHEVRELTSGQRHVARVGAVAVQHGGDLPGLAGPAGEALAELGAGLGGEPVLGHDGNSCRTVRSRTLWSEGLRGGGGPCRPGADTGAEPTASITAVRSDHPRRGNPTTLPTAGARTKP